MIDRMPPNLFMSWSDFQRTSIYLPLYIWETWQIWWRIVRFRKDYPLSSRSAQWNYQGLCIKIVRQEGHRSRRCDSKSKCWRQEKSREIEDAVLLALKYVGRHRKPRKLEASGSWKRQIDPPLEPLEGTHSSAFSLILAH